MGPTWGRQAPGGPHIGPMYLAIRVVEWQDRFDSLKQQGVSARPEDIGVTVEYLNPPFHIKKKSEGYRLVTAF